MVSPTQDPNNTEDNQAASASTDGFWKLIGTAFSFFGKVLVVLKNDTRLSILWGFAVLQLVVLIIVLVLGGLDASAKLAVVIVSMGVLVGLFVYSVPRRKSETSPEPDDAGKAVIERFYRLVAERKLLEAYKMIHPTRIAAIQQLDPSFGPERFASTYATTRQYKNFHIELTHQDELARNYIVAFDVEDEFPHNQLRDLSQEHFSDAFSRGAITSQQMVDGVIEDLRAYYVVPDTAIPWIQKFISNRQLVSLFEPDFVAEVKRNLEKSTNSILTPKDDYPPTVRIWRHYIQTIQVLRENKTWKIGEGLGRSSLAAPYAGSNPP